MKRITKLFKNMNKSDNEVVNENMNDETSKKDENNADQNENSAEKKSENSENAGDDAKMKEFEAKLAEQNDKYLRLYSEFDNFRKRTNKERIELIKTAGEDVIKVILPVIDDFERALKANENASDLASVNEGLKLIYNKMKSSFNLKGLEVMDCMGKDFDADIMEAITNIPAPDESLKGKVVDEVEKGYLLHGKVIRFAKVIVGS
jgi:molecular chaperone GrpE